MTIYAFASFRFDSTRGSLSQAGNELKLRPQTARFLHFVLKNRIRLISKEELVAQVWGEDFVNDQAVFQCVNQLRKALGESAQEPRFLRTIPRKGYRWIFDGVTEESEDKSPAPVEVDKPAPQGPVVARHPQPAVAKRRGRLVALGVVLLSALIYVGLRLGRNAPSATPRARVAFLPFNNATGDSQLQWVELGLMDMVSQSFTGTGDLAPIPTQRVLKAMKDGGIQRGAALTQESALQLRSQLGADWVIGITVRGGGETFILECFSLDPKGKTQDRRYSGSVLTQLAGTMATKLKQELSGDATPTQAFSSDPFVNQTYAHGLQLLYDGFEKKAIPYFEICLQKDPLFLWGGYRLAFCQFQIGQLEQARILAESLMARVAPKESVRGDLLTLMGFLADEKDAEPFHREALTLWRELGDQEGQSVALLNLAGHYSEHDQFQQASEMYKEALVLAQETGDEHTRASVYGMMAQFFFDKNEVAKGLSYMDQELAIWTKLESKENMAYVHINLGDHYAYTGNPELARDHLNKAVTYSKQAGYIPSEVMALNGLGELEIELEQWPQARIPLTRCLDLTLTLGNPYEEMEARLSLAKLGSLMPDEALLKEHGERSIALAQQLVEPEHEIYAWSFYGDFWFNMGDAQKAVTYLDKIREMAEGDHPMVFLMQARAFFVEGDFTRAYEKQNEVKQRWPGVWDGLEERRLQAYKKAQKNND